MLINLRDKIELDKQLENPKFLVMFGWLRMLLPLKYPGLVLTQRTPLMDNEIRDGKCPERYLAINPGQEKSQILNMEKNYIREVQSLALELARNFPYKNRSRWQEIFISIAITGVGIIKQNNGRPKGTGRFRDMDEFVNTIKQVVHEIKIHGDRLTQENIIKYLSSGENIDLRTFQRWREQAGFRNFHELLEWIEHK